MQNDLDLDLAIALWEEGEQIPLTLATRLLAKGFDVEALEAKHLN